MLKDIENIENLNSYKMNLPKEISELSPIINEISEQIISFVNFKDSNKPKQFRQKGILLTGKPGTGKTYIAKKIAGMTLVKKYIVNYQY